MKFSFLNNNLSSNSLKGCCNGFVFGYYAVHSSLSVVCLLVSGLKVPGSITGMATNIKIVIIILPINDNQSPEYGSGSCIKYTTEIYSVQHKINIKINLLVDRISFNIKYNYYNRSANVATASHLHIGVDLVSNTPQKWTVFNIRLI
jgi:hypothetical protein